MGVQVVFVLHALPDGLFVLNYVFLACFDDVMNISQSQSAQLANQLPPETNFDPGRIRSAV